VRVSLNPRSLNPRLFGQYLVTPEISQLSRASHSCQEHRTGPMRRRTEEAAEIFSSCLSFFKV